MLLDSSEQIPRYLTNTYLQNKRKKKKKKSQSTEQKLKSHSEITLSKMNFSVLQKTASQLREAGFFKGKIAGKGVTKDFLTIQIQDTLISCPEAIKVLEPNNS